MSDKILERVWNDLVDIVSHTGQWVQSTLKPRLHMRLSIRFFEATSRTKHRLVLCRGFVANHRVDWKDKYRPLFDDNSSFQFMLPLRGCVVVLRDQTPPRGRFTSQSIGLFATKHECGCTRNSIKERIASRMCECALRKVIPWQTPLHPECIVPQKAITRTHGWTRVANATTIVPLATKNSVSVAKLWLGFIQTPSPDGKCDRLFSQYPQQRADSLIDLTASDYTNHSPLPWTRAWSARPSTAFHLRNIYKNKGGHLSEERA